jgi:hypothetical protein
MRCAGCRYVMRAERRSLARADVWIFTSRSVSGAHAWTCEAPAPITLTDEEHEQIARTFLALLPDVVARCRRASPRLDEAAQAVEVARGTFEQSRDDIRLQVRLGMDAYVGALQARQQALNLALAELAREEARADALTLPSELADLRLQWRSLTPAERRTLMHAAMVCVFVRAGDHAASPRERLRIVWRGAVVELPRKGHVAWTPRPVDFDDLDGQVSVTRVSRGQD